jgi:hypothetical protein
VFNFQYWIEVFQGYYMQHGTIYNDTPKEHPSGLPVIEINSPSGSQWRVLGIHKLTPEENNGNHNVFLEVYCKQNEREGMRAVYWDWQGRHGTEDAPGPVFMAQKGKDDLMDLPIHVPMKIRVWIQNGDSVQWFHSEWPDEAPGNTWGHHSYFVCFQESAWFEDVPAPEPDPDPEPEPEPIEVNAAIQVTANLEWLKTLPVDNEGNITFTIGE